MQNAEGFQYPVTATTSYKDSVESNPYLSDYNEYKRVRDGILQRSNNNFGHFLWQKDLRESFKNIEKICEKIIITKGSRRRSLEYSELLPISILEVLSSLIYFYDHPVFSANPTNYRQLNELGYVRTPLSRCTRRLVFRLQVEFIHSKNQWSFGIYYFREAEWKRFTNLVSTIKARVRMLITFKSGLTEH